MHLHAAREHRRLVRVRVRVRVRARVTDRVTAKVRVGVRVASSSDQRPAAHGAAVLRIS